MTFEIHKHTNIWISFSEWILLCKGNIEPWFGEVLESNQPLSDLTLCTSCVILGRTPQYFSLQNGVMVLQPKGCGTDFVKQSTPNTQQFFWHVTDNNTSH